MDCVSDWVVASGQEKVRIINVIDEYSRKALWTEACASISARATDFFQKSPLFFAAVLNLAETRGKTFEVYDWATVLANKFTLVLMKTSKVSVAIFSY